MLKDVVGHKVALHFTLPEEMRMREVSGILEEFNKEIIKVKVYETNGEISYQYLNRHACTLLSVIDEGEP